MPDYSVQKLHTGVPFLDGMIDSSVRCEPLEFVGAAFPANLGKAGSIIIPDGRNHDRSNVLIKGSPGSGKTVLACQIALNLANDVFFHQRATKPKNSENKPTSVTFEKEFQKSYLDKAVLRPIVPILFTFGHRENELKYLINEIFMQPPKQHNKPSLMELLGVGKIPNRSKTAARLGEADHRSARYPIIVSLAGDDPRTVLHVDDINRCLADIQNRIESIREDVARDKNVGDDDVWSARLKKMKTDLRLGNPMFDFSLKRSNIRRSVGRIAKGGDSGTDGRITYAVFIDSVNDLFPDFNDRAVLHKLFGLSRSFRTVFFHLLEDYSLTGKPEYLYLAKALEFESDVVIDLTFENVPYYRNYLEISKSRYSARVKGRQLYKIAARSSREDSATDNSMRGVNNCVGFQIYLSIHNRFTTSRSIPGDALKLTDNGVTTGLDYLDGIVSMDARRRKKSAAIPPNSFILIQGPTGGHKLALAFNILMGSFKGAGQDTFAEKCVMIVSFRDEHSTDMKRIARVADEERNLFGIEAKADAANGGTNDKITIDESRVRRIGETDPGKKLGNLIEVTFRPGYLTLEEFLFAFEHTVATWQPERVLFDNTDLIKMRFAELSRDATLLAAALRYLKAHNILSIIIDVVETGSDEALSYGLRGMADYIIQTEPLESFAAGHHVASGGRDAAADKEFIDVPNIVAHDRRFAASFPFPSGLLPDERPKLMAENLRLAVMSISNPRNKVYSRNFIALTAIGKASLFGDAAASKHGDIPENLLLLGSIDEEKA